MTPYQQRTRPNPTREIVGALPSAAALEEAVTAITSAGWDRSELSLLAQHGVLAGEPVDDDTRTIADDPGADRQAVVSEPDIRQGRTLAAGMAGVVGAFVASGATVLSGGAVLAAVVGAAVVGGGAAAAVERVASAATKTRGDHLRDQVEHGGILLWVKLHEPSDESKARDILARHGATDIHVHPVASEFADAPERNTGARRT